MCTALKLQTKDSYFGRNLDLDISYGEQVCVMPRRFPIPFRNMGTMEEHYAMIGMAAVVNGIPLFFDAVNEQGLAMAGLNFPGNAWYPPAETGYDNVPPYEFISWILAQCESVREARALLERIRLADQSFSPQMPLSPLHWILSDFRETIVIESMRDGLHVHDNPTGVLTNNPPFEYQMFHLNNFRGLGADNGENRFAEELDLQIYSQGLGAVGLPGDLSSMSRFVRMVFHSQHSVCADDEFSSIGQFFHLLGTVEMTRGSCLTDHGTWDITQYTGCMNMQRGLYYYTTYDNRQIHCIDMHREALDGRELAVYAMVQDQQICYQNERKQA